MGLAEVGGTCRCCTETTAGSAARGRRTAQPDSGKKKVKKVKLTVSPSKPTFWMLRNGYESWTLLDDDSKGLDCLSEVKRAGSIELLSLDL